VPPPPPPPATPPSSCLVPAVVGKPLAKAKTAIAKAHCRVGKIARVRSSKARKGRVLKESPRPRTKLKNGAKVNLTVGRGP
jgi:beta-lactam-binding protein with PASTA domain